MFIYFLVIWRVKLLLLRSSRFCKGYWRILKKKRGLQWTKQRGYCPFPTLGRDTVGGVATGTACMCARPSGCASNNVRQSECAPTTRALSERQAFLGPRSRHQFLCRDMAGLGKASPRSRHDFHVATRAPVGGSRLSFWRRDTEAARELRLGCNTLFVIATWDRYLNVAT